MRENVTYKPKNIKESTTITYVANLTNLNFSILFERRYPDLYALTPV